MTTYTDDLVFELRMLEVPGTRIGEILAEVQSHIAETGEDPVDAFGPVKDYARERAGLEVAAQQGGFLTRLFHGHWLMFLAGLAYTFIAARLMIGGGMALASERFESPFGLNPWAALIIGVVLLAAWGVWLLRLLKADPIVDPRTGRQVEWDLRGRRKDANGPDGAARP